MDDRDVRADAPPPKPLASGRVQFAILAGGLLVLAVGLLVAPRAAAPPARSPEAATPILLDETRPSTRAAAFERIAAQAAPATVLLPLPLGAAEVPSVPDWAASPLGAPPNLHGGVVVTPEGLVLTSTRGLRLAVGIPVRLASGRGAVAHLEVHDPAIGLGLLRLEDGGPFVSATAAPRPPELGDTLTGGLAVPGGPLLADGTVVSVGPDTVLLTGLPGDVVSGLPLFDSEGRLAAITGGSSSGTLTAYLVDAVLERAETLRREGRALPSAIGVSLQPVSSALAARFPAGGSLVSDVAAGSPAEIADIRPGDVLVRINDQPAFSTTDAALAGAGRAPGGRGGARGRPARRLGSDADRHARAAHHRRMEQHAAAAGRGPARVGPDDPVQSRQGGMPRDARVLLVNGRPPKGGRLAPGDLIYVAVNGRRFFAVVPERPR